MSDAPNLGRLEAARQRAVARLSDGGYSRLTSQVGGKIAEVTSNWQKDRQLAREITMPNGRHPHPESVARVRRKLRDDGLISSQRVFVNGKLPTGAKYDRSSRGTTIKVFNWAAVGLKNPFNHRERRRQRMDQARILRERGELQKAPPPQRDRPRHVSARALVDPSEHLPTRIDPEFAAKAEQIQRDQERNAARRAELAAAAKGARSGQVPGRVLPPERPPPE